MPVLKLVKEGNNKRARGVFAPCYGFSKAIFPARRNSIFPLFNVLPYLSSLKRPVLIVNKHFSNMMPKSSVLRSCLNVNVVVRQYQIIHAFCQEQNTENAVCVLRILFLRECIPGKENQQFKTYERLVFWSFARLFRLRVTIENFTKEKKQAGVLLLLSRFSPNCNFSMKHFRTRALKYKRALKGVLKPTPS